MKIAFIGTHGVGKTTLCYELAGRLKRGGIDADIVKEVARTSPLPINQQTSLDAQTWILMTQIAEEIRSGARHEIVVCDRSVLDNYAYLAHACGRQPALEHLVDHWLATYDLLIKVPVAGAVSPDGIRDVDDAFVRAIDRLVDRLLSEKRTPHLALESSERERWMDDVCERVEAAFRSPSRAST